MASIHRAVQQMDSNIPYHMIRKFLKQFHSQQEIRNRRAFKPRKLALHLETIRRVIKQSYENDSSITVPKIKQLLQSRFISVSETYIRSLRDQLGFRRRTTKYCQQIRDANKEARLGFCLDKVASNETFFDCVFTDESTIQGGRQDHCAILQLFRVIFKEIIPADCSVKHCYVKDGEYLSRLRKRAKHPPKLHLWGGISARGATQLAVFPGSVRLDSRKYCEILERVYLPFNRNIYHGRLFT